jgi:hypothetical protein
MNLQDIKTQLDALNHAVSEMETAKAEYTFTKDQMERFVLHMTETLIEAIKSEIDHNFEVDEDAIETEVINGGYGRDFTIDLSIDNHEIKRNIKDIIESSYDSMGIMDEVDNCYSAIVSPVEPTVEPTVETTQD